MTPGCLLAWDALHGTLGVNGVNYAIRTTGMLALVFLLLTLAITPVRKIVKGVPLIAVRRSLGLGAFFYLVVHVSLFYGLDRAASLTSTVHEILARRYLQLGAIAFLLMVPLAATSTNAMVRRLGAIRWKRLHRLAYLVVILGCIHYILLVKADRRQPFALSAVAAALLGSRVAVLRRRRIERAWSGKLRILDIKQETPDVKTLRLGALSGGALPFSFLPGQYMNVSFALAERPVRRSYTIASSAVESRYCEITVKRTGDGWVSRHIHEALTEGDLITVTAPAGSFVFDSSTSGEPRITLIGGGVGITPLMSILRSSMDRAFKGRIDMILAMRTEADVVFAAELADLSRRCPDLRVTVLLTRETSAQAPYRAGRLDEKALREILGAGPPGPVYLCGPDAMMRDVRAALLSLGLEDAAIHTERFVSPTAEPSAPQGSDDGVTHEVTFDRREMVLEVPRRLTLLEAAEEAGLSLPFECRSGICGQCKLRVLEGEVAMDSTEALSRNERVEGFVLACQARPRSNLVVDG
jgi:ferredoxin-NADP reductase/DMSO/TMAO reductase YedYZ heme-binding membrane subunit